MRSELGGALATGLVIASIYIFSKAPYEASSFDIAAAAVPFAVATITTILAITRSKVANKPVKRAYGSFLLVVMLLCYGSIFSISMKVVSNAYGIWASTWLQLTTLFGALASYETRRMLFVLKDAWSCRRSCCRSLDQTGLMDNFRVWQSNGIFT